MGCWGRKGGPRRPASVLGFLLRPEGGGNWAWSPAFMGGDGARERFPGDLEGRARLRGRRGGSQRQGAVGAPCAGPADLLVGQQPGTGLSFEVRMHSALSWKGDPFCRLGGEGVGSLCRSLSSAPGRDPCGTCWPRCSGVRVAAVPPAGVD